MENPIKMDDWGVPLFLETPICQCEFSKATCIDEKQDFLTESRNI